MSNWINVKECLPLCGCEVEFICQNGARHIGWRMDDRWERFGDVKGEFGLKLHATWWKEIDRLPDEVRKKA